MPLHATISPAISLTGISANHVNLLQAVRDSDFMGLVSLLACLALSVVCWAIIAYKYQQLRRAVRSSDQFIERCLRGSGSLEDAFRASHEFPASPLAHILRETYLEMQMENWYADGTYSQEEQLTACRLGVERVMERTITNELRQMETYLIFLATTSSVAPFIGLFGTVWGVLAAFQALSKAGNAALAALAPGMATALIATLAGLIAAIPASIFYNYLSNKITIMTSRMDSFALELANIIQKRLIKQSSGHYGPRA